MSGPNTEARPDTTRRSSWSVFGGTAERGPSIRGAAALARRHEGPRAPARRRKPRQVRCQPRRRPGSRRYRATDQWGTKAERAAAPIHACWPTTVMCDSGTRAAPRLITGWQAAAARRLAGRGTAALVSSGQPPAPGWLPSSGTKQCRPRYLGTQIRVPVRKCHSGARWQHYWQLRPAGMTLDDLELTWTLNKRHTL